MLILIAPLMILIGFDRESHRTDFERPFVGFAIYGCFAGVLLHAIARGGATQARIKDADSAYR